MKKTTLQSGPMDHVVLEVRDSRAAAQFYHKILKFPPVRLKEFLAGDVLFASARVNDVTLVDFFPPALWHNRRRQSNPNHICFTMSEQEVTALKRRLSRNKVRITRRSPLSFGAQGWGDSTYFEDPDGVTVEVRFYGKDAKKELPIEEIRAQSEAARKMIAAARKKSAKS